MTHISETCLICKRHDSCIRAMTHISETCLIYKRHASYVRDMRDKGDRDLELVVGDSADGLLAHGTLVRVAWRLVVVWVWNQPRTRAHNSEGVNLKMGCCRRDSCFIEDNHRMRHGSYICETDAYICKRHDS